MTKPFIPEIKSEVILVQDWTFNLWCESRNDTFGQDLGLEGYKPSYYGQTDISVSATLPAGTVLIIDRLYVRNGASDYSSVTFRTKEKVNKRKCRFWVKLQEFNDAPLEVVHDQGELNVQPTVRG